MEDFTELLAFVELELLSVDQAVWLACDQAPPAGIRAHDRPTERHVIAERRIRAEVPILKAAMDGVLSLTTSTGTIRSRVDAVRRVHLVAWFRTVTSAFGRRFLAAVDSAGFELTGDVDQDRITAWCQLCHDIPAARTRVWTNKDRFAELQRRHLGLFNVSLDHFIRHIWPNLRAAMPMLD